MQAPLSLQLIGDFGHDAAEPDNEDVALVFEERNVAAEQLQAIPVIEVYRGSVNAQNWEEVAVAANVTLLLYEYAGKLKGTLPFLALETERWTEPQKNHIRLAILVREILIGTSAMAEGLFRNIKKKVQEKDWKKLFHKNRVKITCVATLKRVMAEYEAEQEREDAAAKPESEEHERGVPEEQDPGVLKQFKELLQQSSRQYQAQSQMNMMKNSSNKNKG